MIANVPELLAYLADAQAERAAEIRCVLSPGLSARLHDSVLIELLISGLPMAQGVKHRIVRCRGKGTVLTANIHYRDGVRMLSDADLTKEQAAALETARSITAAFLALEQEERFGSVYDWVCCNIHYVHTAPGQKGYERLVGAAGVLAAREANCQGFADVLYLLCGLCGIACEYRIGKGERRLHVWNAVCLNGVWQEADASRGARENSCWFDKSPTNFRQTQKNTTQDEKLMI